MLSLGISILPRKLFIFLNSSKKTNIHNCFTLNTYTYPESRYSFIISIVNVDLFLHF